MKWPWVSRTAYDLALSQLAALQERNDRLVEAASQSKAGAPVIMPRQPVELEPGAGWWDTKPFQPPVPPRKPVVR